MVLFYFFVGFFECLSIRGSTKISPPGIIFSSSRLLKQIQANLDRPAWTFANKNTFIPGSNVQQLDGFPNQLITHVALNDTGFEEDRIYQKILFSTSGLVVSN